MPSLRLRCRDAHRLLSLRRDARLGRIESLGLWLHLAACASCRNVGRSLQWLGRAARGLDRD